jgi:hypothetical protein
MSYSSIQSNSESLSHNLRIRGKRAKKTKARNERRTARREE